RETGKACRLRLQGVLVRQSFRCLHAASGHSRFKHSARPSDRRPRCPLLKAIDLLSASCLSLSIVCFLLRVQAGGVRRKSTSRGGAAARPFSPGYNERVVTGMACIFLGCVETLAMLVEVGVGARA